ncbi:hypothetical protein U9M48_004961, partial [Paspalum notatum var. saurae]
MTNQPIPIFPCWTNSNRASFQTIPCPRPPVKQLTILVFAGRKEGRQPKSSDKAIAVSQLLLRPPTSSSPMGLFRSPPKVYKPAAEVDLGPDSDEHYISPNVKAPRVAGFLVKMLAWVLETPVLGWLVLAVLKRDNLVYKVHYCINLFFLHELSLLHSSRLHVALLSVLKLVTNSPSSSSSMQLVSDAEIPEPPLFTATHTWQAIPEQNVSLTKPGLSPAERVQEAAGCIVPDDAPSPGFRRWTVLDFHRAYSSGQTTPVMVARRFLAAVEECSGAGLDMGMFISCDAADVMRQAEDSARRYHQGAPLSAMDGVLVAVKDELDCLPYPTTGGTRWLRAARRCAADAACVAQLRACGALGAGTSGINPHHGATRNPYCVGRVSGGSSGGSAAAVCAGLCPVALGADGGGSVRMPAALCGVVGFKPTAGRLSNSGLLPLNWTVGMPGILAATVEDTLIAYAAIADQSKPSPLQQPELNLPLLTRTRSMPTIRLARYAKWFDDSSEDIRSLCGKALQALRAQYGWETVEVTVPEIEEMRLAHYVTMGSECTASLANYLDNMNRSEIGWDVRIGLSAYRSFSSRDYLNSQRLRCRQMYFHEKIFETADAIVTPMTGVTAYALQEDARSTGELDYINGAALVRYSIAGNFLGLPAITVPVGYDRAGLPVGLQFIGRPWSEATLLHLAYAVQEACGKEHRRKPRVHYDLLTKEVNRSEIGWDVRIGLSAYRSFSSRDYLNSQRLRRRQLYFHEKIFETADAIVTPMTGVTAYALQEDARSTGELDYINGAALVRYSIAGNFLGLPAITVPVGYDRGGLPVGLQFIGRPWSEATLLHLAYAVQEACGKEHRRKPKVHYDLLSKE